MTVLWAYLSQKFHVDSRESSQHTVLGLLSVRLAGKAGQRAWQKPGRKGVWERWRVSAEGWGALAAVGGSQAQWQPQALTTMLRCFRRMTLLLLS